VKVGIVTTWFERGAAIVSKQFMDVLENLGCEVYIFARGGEEFAKTDPNWHLENVTWNSFLYSNIPTDINKRQYIRWLKQYDISVVLFNEQQFYQPVIWTKELGIPAVAYVDYYTKENYKAFDVYDQLWCNTKRHFSAFEWHPGAKYLPWGTDTDIYKGSKDKPQYLFFHSAGMSPFRKGTDVLVEAVWKIRGGLKNSGNKVLIHTQTSLFRAQEELGQKLHELINMGVVDVVTKTVSAPGLYYMAKIYVYPSRLEGIGLTLAEAACSGLYVVTTDEAPMNEFALEDVSSKIPVSRRFERADRYYWDMVEPDVNALADKMGALVEADIPPADYIAARAKAEFDFKNNMRKLTELLNGIEMRLISDVTMDCIYKSDRGIGIVLKRRLWIFRFIFMVMKRLKKYLKK